MSTLTRVESNDTVYGSGNLKNLSFFNNSQSALNNDANHFTLQILPKSNFNNNSSGQSNITNDLTGNTLVTNSTSQLVASPNSDFTYNDNYINNSYNFRNEIFNNNNNEKRLSISEYITDRTNYYEYEKLELNLNEFGILSPQEDTDFDAFSIMTDLEDTSLPAPDLDKSSTKKVMNYFKLNIFNNTHTNSNNSNSTLPMDNMNTNFQHTTLNTTEESPQIFKKRYFWSRNKNIKKESGTGSEKLLNDDNITFDQDSMLNDDDSRLIIDPSQLITKSNTANPTEGQITNDFLSSPDFIISGVENSIFSDDFTENMKIEELEHIEIDTKVIVPSIFVEDFKIDKKTRIPNKTTDHSNAQSIILPKKIGILPKTRGRKPSPILDSSKQFGCDYCERRFKRQEHLKRHVRSLHMCVKPYACHICDKKFSRSDNLSQHIKTHTH
ncbi:hypothetical protein TPHA_0D01050 [Tetrapisispora phaffii CBS 4417]|uniref:C2H2-type domain-containing protein n=1 Tax=Tetrapisispora phaffii (strain ATCC 24235 / CBS 4417 / NBRC 1672 / NRRL Y-8282 / UCD 70-5) TaxID=1071381 RepID=G8BSC5_TETPH|nr:hypothetical protein TPHA_0D01050 [Tetrapisispora phaffii CBS 4417]CCE62746.1 hypothetical protein TPHA_0D01050 [Tetrapisispora phaffii CBS 4417]